MDYKQVSELVNAATLEATGESGIITEDLQGVVDTGRTIENLDSIGKDKWVHALINQIGHFVIKSREYTASMPSLLREAWEWGSVAAKVRFTLHEAQDNESWELQDGASYDQDVFYGTSASQKLWNKATTFEVPVSFAERQIKQSFTGPAQLAGFVSGIEVTIRNTLAVKTRALAFAALSNMIGETLYSEVPGGTYTGRSGPKAVNLLYLYNTRFPGSAITSAADALTDPDFLRFAALQIKIYMDRLKEISTIYNIAGAQTFTPRDQLHLILHTDFAAGADVYLQSDVYHNELTKLPEAEKVAYWQGSGTGFAFADTTKIDITTSGGHSIEATGILGVMYDHLAVGVAMENRRVTAHNNARAEFYTQWHKNDARYWNDFDENFIVFYAAVA